MPVPVEVVVDGVVLGSTLANLYRADLATAGYGHGRHGFDFRFPAPLASSLRSAHRATRNDGYGATWAIRRT
jgi:O-antigen biosynthesis protein